MDVSAAVAADQTLAFTDASGLLQLNDPASFAGTITGFNLGSTIDLTIQLHRHRHKLRQQRADADRRHSTRCN